MSLSRRLSILDVKKPPKNRTNISKGNFVPDRITTRCVTLVYVVLLCLNLVTTEKPSDDRRENDDLKKVFQVFESFCTHRLVVDLTLHVERLFGLRRVRKVESFFERFGTNSRKRRSKIISACSSLSLHTKCLFTYSFNCIFRAGSNRIRFETSFECFCSGFFSWDRRRSSGEEKCVSRTFSVTFTGGFIFDCSPKDIFFMFF